MTKKIQKTLEEVYGKGVIVSSLAEYITEHRDHWENTEDPENALMLYIWNWFPGGDTARLAANKVMEALGGRKKV